MESEENTAERIIKLRKQLKLSQKVFADKIEITQGALSQLESGKSTLSLQTISNICQIFDIDCNWLVLGIGREFKPLAAVAKSEEIDNLISPTKAKKLFTANLVPLIKEEAHAGYINQCHNEDYVEALDVYRIPGFENGHYRMFEIEGDSMIPSIYPREIVVTESISDWSQIENGTLCIIIADEGIVAKRIYSYKEEPSVLMLKSDNPDYKTYSIAFDKVKEIWEIKAKITSVLNADDHPTIERFKTMESDIQDIKNKLNNISSIEEKKDGKV
tara:strand:+ start:2010 stop:2828 length:819 start_codon:yes stop_codon:yes gene_type:complete